MIEGAWKASPWAMSEDGRDCHFRKAEWFEARSAALARLVALDRTTTKTPAGLAFSPPYAAVDGVSGARMYDFLNYGTRSGLACV